MSSKTASGKQEVSAFEAKTHLSELLRETERGVSFVILRHGNPVAQLIPPDISETQRDFSTVLEAFREIRKRVGGRGGIRALIDEGRRF